MTSSSLVGDAEILRHGSAAGRSSRHVMTAACAYPCWRLLRITVRQSVNGILVNEWSGFCQDKEAYEVLNEEGAFTAIS